MALLTVCAVLARSVVVRIRPGEKGLLLTLGRLTKVMEPGWHFKAPIFQRLIKVKAEDVGKALAKFGVKRGEGE